MAVTCFVPPVGCVLTVACSRCRTLLAESRWANGCHCQRCRCRSAAAVPLVSRRRRVAGVIAARSPPPPKQPSPPPPPPVCHRGRGCEDALNAWLSAGRGWTQASYCRLTCGRRSLLHACCDLAAAWWSPRLFVGCCCCRLLAAPLGLQSVGLWLQCLLGARRLQAGSDRLHKSLPPSRPQFAPSAERPATTSLSALRSLQTALAGLSAALRHVLRDRGTGASVRWWAGHLHPLGSGTRRRSILAAVDEATHGVATEKRNSKLY